MRQSMRCERWLSLTPTLCLCWLSGCAVSIGGNGKDLIVCGLLHIGRTFDSPTTIIDQHMLGVGLRSGTSDDGVTLGYSGMRTVFPNHAGHERPKWGFRWPLGIAWANESTGVFHELGWIATRVPQPDDVSLTHHTLLGAGCMMSNRGVGAAVGYRDRVRVEAPVDRDALYVVRYKSDKPFESVFAAINGDDHDD